MLLRHTGEVNVRRLAGLPEYLNTELSEYADTCMPIHHQIFYAQLPYFVAANVDEELQPWATLLVQPLFAEQMNSPTQLLPPRLLQPASETEMKISTLNLDQDGVRAWTPWSHFLSRTFNPANNTKLTEANRMFAGLGLDFANRRRNKIAGFITSVNNTRLNKSPSSSPSSPVLLETTVTANETIGNCPKYINIRRLQLFRRPSPRPSSTLQVSTSSSSSSSTTSQSASSASSSSSSSSSTTTTTTTTTTVTSATVPALSFVPSSSSADIPEFASSFPLHNSSSSSAASSSCSSLPFSSNLPPFALSHIEAADAIFLATRHLGTPELGATDASCSMDANIRGGAPGFVRVRNVPHPNQKTQSQPNMIHENEPVGGISSFVYIPDYSGNRIFSSLGNIFSDGVAGVTVPNFRTGDVLYLTGSAKLLWNEDAERLMPRVQRLIEIRVTRWVWVANALDLIIHNDIHDNDNNKASNNGVAEYSPYNPPVRLLADELLQKRKSLSTNEEKFDDDGEHADGTASTSIPLQLMLTDSVMLAPDIRTFHCRILPSSQSLSSSSSSSSPSSSSISYVPGQYGLFDLSGERESDFYQHMNSRDPQLLNDDFLRNWTISSSPVLSEVTNTQLLHLLQQSNEQNKPTGDSDSNKGLTLHDNDDKNENQGEDGMTSVSSSPVVYEVLPCSTLNITVKRVPSGRISTLLHSRAAHSHSSLQSTAIRLKHVDGAFSCFAPVSLPSSSSSSSSSSSVFVSLKQSNMVWIAAGSGLTPFLSMWTALKQLRSATAPSPSPSPSSSSSSASPPSRQSTHVTLLFSCRGESEVMMANTLFCGVDHLIIFDTQTPPSTTITSASTPSLYHRRLNEHDIRLFNGDGSHCNHAHQPNSTTAPVHYYVCGPSAFSSSVLQWLSQSGVDALRIHHESFRF